MIATALFDRFQSSMAISGYMAALCAVSFVSVLVLTETHKKEHRAQPAKPRARAAA
jgi:hypothetical protein